MAQLMSLKDDIDQGQIAKLSVTPERSNLSFTVRIKKGTHQGEACYIWQHITMMHGEIIATYSRNPQTDFFPTWEQLLEGIKGDQTETYGWQITDEPLQPYLPERKFHYKQTPLP